MDVAIDANSDKVRGSNGGRVRGVSQRCICTRGDRQMQHVRVEERGVERGKVIGMGYCERRAFAWKEETAYP